MPDGRKRILSPFTGRKKRKAWNKTREKYMPVKRRQSLDETDEIIFQRGMVRLDLENSSFAVTRPWI